MCTTRRIALAALLAAFIAACTQTTPYRNKTIERNDAENRADDVCVVTSGKDGPGKCGQSAIEHQKYSYDFEDTNGNPDNVKGDYYVSYVEFDDQGWFQDRNQMEDLLRLLHDGEGSTEGSGTTDAKKGDYLILVFAHGWRHNASTCDNNVVCFRRLLERMAIMEDASSDLTGDPARKVIGVYVGWRGKSANVQPFELASFWDRKNTAKRVGLGGVSELLVRLNDFRRFKNPFRDGAKTQLIVTGHSFGAKVIYSALSQNLIERAAWMQDQDGKLSYSTANSFGDLVILVNPAFEGALYEPLHDIAANRCYPDRQRPAMLVVTSKADQATKTTFPLGRGISNLFESSTSKKQQEAVRKTVGHLDRYKTHDLEMDDDSAIDWKTEIDSSKCGCPYLKPIDQFLAADWATEKSFLKDLFDDYQPLLQAKRKKEYKKLLDKAKKEQINITDKKKKTLWDEASKAVYFLMYKDLKKKTINYGDDIRLIRNPDYVPNHPYMVISTDENLIGGHNQIFGESFTRCIRYFYVKHIRARNTFPQACYKPSECINSDITPCERSCRRDADDDASCSDHKAPG